MIAIVLQTRPGIGGSTGGDAVSERAHHRLDADGVPPRQRPRRGRVRHHLSRTRHAAREGRRHQGVLSQRRGLARRYRARHAHGAWWRLRLRGRARPLPQGSAHPRRLQPSQHRARRALLQGERDRLHGDGLRARRVAQGVAQHPSPTRGSADPRHRRPAPRRHRESPRDRLPAPRHQARQHLHPPDRRPGADRFRLGAPGARKLDAHAHRDGHAGLRPVRAVRRRFRAGPLHRPLRDGRRALLRDDRAQSTRRDLAHQEGSPRRGAANRHPALRRAPSGGDALGDVAQGVGPSSDGRRMEGNAASGTRQRQGELDQRAAHRERDQAADARGSRRDSSFQRGHGRARDARHGEAPRAARHARARGQGEIPARPHGDVHRPQGLDRDRRGAGRHRPATTARW